MRSCCCVRTLPEVAPHCNVGARPIECPSRYACADMASLSRSDVEHVAHLARLGLTEDELSRLEGQLNHILDQYSVLAQLDTEHIPPTAQTIEVENILREDTVRPSLSRDEILAAAPEKRSEYFVVPPILGEHGS